MSSVLEELGGDAGCQRLAKQFYERVAQSDVLKPLFPGRSLRCATEEFAAFLIQFLEGEEAQTQYRWWLSLRESHARFKISEAQRRAWLGLMQEVLDSVVAGPSLRAALVQFFEGVSVYVVGGEEAPVKSGELADRWARQRALDQLIEDLAQGRDLEAMQAARSFVARPSVFVGILARMMALGRPVLVQFAVENVMMGAFNGRTLLHHACSSACWPVVQRMLAMGVDPDVLDSGGHTPLYRVAGCCRDAEGAAIVAALVRAGANVDRAGGVSRSTALHEAARHGSVGVAMSLVAHGANRLAKDRHGFTPLDRARRCRRLAVAEVLTSASKEAT